MKARLNKRERRAAALLAHYETCERLAGYLHRNTKTVSGQEFSRIRYTNHGAHAPAETWYPTENLKTLDSDFEFVTGSDFDGKKISVALLKIERDAHHAATAQCNGEGYKCQPFRDYTDDGEETSPWDVFCAEIERRVGAVFGGVVPPGFFFNKDPRGYALKIDNETPEGRALIDDVSMQKDWGGYGILSPEITG